MAAFQSIEATGPRLAFGIVHFLRVFVADALPGVLAENPSGTNTVPRFFQIVEANSGAG